MKSRLCDNSTLSLKDSWGKEWWKGGELCEVYRGGRYTLMYMYIVTPGIYVL